ncbi:proline dehydrogenase family protein [Gordonia caeni]|uniref:L-glutamate gamma-semialdehyde dehydrogenase n=1 Tax=Gordonia caeni TaxID=1007097 RepID=A0ABP7P9I3_9ACTN
MSRFAPTELADLDQCTRDLVGTWLATAAATGHRRQKAAARLAAVLADPHGLGFTVGFVDRVIGTEDPRAAAAALAELAGELPASLPRIDRLQLRVGGALGRLVPRVVVPIARARMRAMVGHLIVDARDRPLTESIAALRRGGHRLNLNPLGEAVLGEAEADRHLEQVRRLLRRDDVDYVSIKISSVASQLSMWDFEGTVRYVVDRLAPLYREAAAAPPGTAFLNLDMEEYRDLRLTVEVFTRLLRLPELAHYEAGIVVQAYLPDAVGAFDQLADFAADRVRGGGAGLKVRLVKGANLAMERVHAELAGRPAATCATKLDTDVNYKRILCRVLNPETMTGLRLGVAGHNLFDIAFAHLLAERRGVTDHVEFEMLAGMVPEQAETVSADVGPLLLYVPTVAPREFDVAISYLVRRLEENAAPENFMSGIFDLAPGSATHRREEQRFSDAVAALAAVVTDPRVPGPRDRQDRTAEQSAPAVPVDPASLPPFASEPDTNPALPANQEWARAALAQSAEPGWLDALPVPPPGDRASPPGDRASPPGDRAQSRSSLDRTVATARAAAAQWAARPAAERAAILYRAADLLSRRRGHLIAVAAAEAGKSIAESDPEVSEAVDFARYYAHRALELERVRGADFTPDRLIVVTPPWNFPIAIPTGGTVAALAAGAAVILKPAGPVPRCAQVILEALWEAGVPRAVCVGVYPDEGPAGEQLLRHPGVDRVLLTGASETAALFAAWRPGRPVNAETSGKNALIVTPSADRDLAIADLVHSAFGHAGQKCSAASLGILVGSVHDSARFRRQLVDAASSLVVDWPVDAAAAVGPLTEEPTDKLFRALTTLEPGERWLLRPQRLDDTGRLWSPGIKDGVAPGSLFHRTEVFGPVLGLMRAHDLDEALALQNGTDFGLTAGLHSRDLREVRTWLDGAQAGNLYVNRGITGAIVGRQPFGGWKGSSAGLGSKAGGPNYLMLMGTWSDAPAAASPSAPTLPAVAGFVAELATALDADSAHRLSAAAADDDAAWEAEFARGTDPAGLRCEANIFRYRPAAVLVRIGAGAPAWQAARVLAAAARAGIVPRISADPGLGRDVAGVLAAARTHLGIGPAGQQDEQSFAAAVPGLPESRIRVVGGVSDRVRAAVAARPRTALLDDPVTRSGRVELRYWLAEQAVSITLHRFGNPAPAFHRLAADLKD